jgi:hypothetical protein
MDMGKLLKDTADQHNCSRYQGSMFALKEATTYIQSLVNENETPNQIAIKITKYLVDKVNQYKILIESTDMGKKMKDLEN